MNAKGLYVSKNIQSNEEELVIDVGGLKGKIKYEELELQNLPLSNKISDYIGTEFYVKILSLEKDILYCSRKEAQMLMLENEITVGKELTGTISKLNTFGAQITFCEGMLSSFIKNEELMENKCKISDKFKLEEEIQVIIDKIDFNDIYVKPTQKYSMKKIEYLSKISEGEIISGTISTCCIDKNFVKIAPGVNVLCNSVDGDTKYNKVDVEITKVDIKNNFLRGKIVDIKKINTYINSLEEGKIVIGNIRKIQGDEFYVKIYTCVYVKCKLNKSLKIKVGDNIRVKINSIKSHEILGEYIDDEKVREILNGARVGDIIKSKIIKKDDFIYEVITTTGITVICKNIDNSLSIDDEVFIEIGFINDNATVNGIIINKEKTNEYIKLRRIGEELRGRIIQVDTNKCVVKASVGVNIICNIPENINVKNSDKVKIKISNINEDESLLYGDVIENITEIINKQYDTKIEDLNDFSRPFVIYGWDKPNFINKNKYFNKYAFMSMVDSNKISEKDKCIVRFLMDCRFATFNQISRFLNTYTEFFTKNRSSLQKKLSKLIEKRVINGFKVKNGNLVVYCLDICGKMILDKENNKKSKNWTTENVNKSWNVIGKNLISTEVYVKTKEKYPNSEIEYNASPYIYEDLNPRKSYQVMFSMKVKDENIQTSIIGEVYRKDDIERTFDKRIGNIENYLENNLWIGEFDSPKVVIVVESDERIQWAKEKLGEQYPNIMKDYLITTDLQINKEIFI